MAEQTSEHVLAMYRTFFWPLELLIEIGKVKQYGCFALLLDAHSTASGSFTSKQDSALLNRDNREHHWEVHWKEALEPIYYLDFSLVNHWNNIDDPLFVSSKGFLMLLQHQQYASWFTNLKRSQEDYDKSGEELLN